MNKDTAHSLTCFYCDEPIAMGDEIAKYPVSTEFGTRAAHVECAYRAVSGGINHLTRVCHCYGGTEPPDPPELSKRAAARLAYNYGVSPLRRLP